MILFGFFFIYLVSTTHLSERILGDTNLYQVLKMARNLLKTGFNAGGGYEQVFIRDSNTFLEVCADVIDHSHIRKVLLNFFSYQGSDGSIPDGYDPHTFKTFKATVETDQETSLVQAVYKYIKVSGDTSILQEIVNGTTVLERIELAFQFLLHYRLSPQYGLIWGATTIDWGDVQPEDNPGTEFDAISHPSIDIYDNSMFAIGIKNYLTMLTNNTDKYVFWTAWLKEFSTNIMKYLWNEKSNKFIPHLYLEKGSPFPKNFTEEIIYYQGGTTVAIEANLLNKSQILSSLWKMIENKQHSGATTIGLTIFPVYPTTLFKNPYLHSYTYQNGGDWTWFGGRMIQQLMENGFVIEAYQEITPMVQRVIKNNDFFEWYSVNTGKPSGSNNFRGSAGVLGKAVKMLLTWAENHK